MPQSQSSTSTSVARARPAPGVRALPPPSGCAADRHDTGRPTDRLHGEHLHKELLHGERRHGEHHQGAHRDGGGRHRPAVDTEQQDARGEWLRFAPVQPLFRALAAQRLAVLAYHGVTDHRSFGAQLDRLQRLATPVSLDAVLQAVTERQPLPPRSVLVTFDDADRSVLTHALPALDARGIPATAFVISELIGTERPFWWHEADFLARHGGRARSLDCGHPSQLLRRLKAMPDPDRRRSLHELRVSADRRPPRQEQLTPGDLLALRDGGVAIGNHTQGHPCLGRCDDDTVRAEITGAHEALTRWLGEPPTAFAYPDGGHDVRAEIVLQELGYRLGFLSDHRLGPRLPSHPLQISRLQVDSTTSTRRFDTILSGLEPAYRRWRRQAVA
ncbi:polysaccharide deacetylase family protein [Streptomyces sp. LS1784]|uniref:polysaccharide deacetylase family protein n=1 Tax=Streptomyces sp. LS1784 TaxID=2851533 RepID=UPI001CCB7A88|nr:polysaccharide deacetylase family protein [Streptomyces sp. LS1784]